MELHMLKAVGVGLLYIAGLLIAALVPSYGENSLLALILAIPLFVTSICLTYRLGGRIELLTDE